MKKKGFYIYLIIESCGDDWDIVCIFKNRLAAMNYFKVNEPKYYRLHIKRMFVRG